MGPRAPSHLVPRTTSYPASVITKRSVRNRAVDEEGRVADYTLAGDLLAIGDHGRETGPPA